MNNNTFYEHYKDDKIVGINSFDELKKLINDRRELLEQITIETIEYIKYCKNKSDRSDKEELIVDARYELFHLHRLIICILDNNERTNLKEILFDNIEIEHEGNHEPYIELEMRGRFKYFEDSLIEWFNETTKKYMNFVDYQKFIEYIDKNYDKKIEEQELNDIKEYFLDIFIEYFCPITEKYGANYIENDRRQYHRKDFDEINDIIYDIDTDNIKLKWN